MQITKRHLSFVQEAREAFENNPDWYTYRDAHDSLIALRYGADRDCVLVYELGEEIANFVQQTEPCPVPRKPVMEFAFDMEVLLKANDHWGGWDRSSDAYLFAQIQKNLSGLDKELSKDDRDKQDITIRCANIANFAMMIADNEGQHL